MADTTRNPNAGPLASIDLLAGTAASDDTPLHIPHWGPMDHTESAVAAMDAGDPWPVRTPDQQRAECHRQRFAGRLEGALIGFCIALVLIVGGCSVIAALDREPIHQTTYRPATA